MATEMQKKANKRNALRSTGPRTPEGKAAAAGNARKHGLSGRDAVLSEEDEELFAGMLEGMFFVYRPEGELETFLVKRIATGIWRLLRVEAALYEEPENSFFDRKTGLGERFRSQTRHGANSFATLCRVESATERAVFRTMHELQRVQAMRKGNEVPPPMALDVLLSAGAGQ